MLGNIFTFKTITQLNSIEYITSTYLDFVPYLSCAVSYCNILLLYIIEAARYTATHSIGCKQTTAQCAYLTDFLIILKATWSDVAAKRSLVTITLEKYASLSIIINNCQQKQHKIVCIIQRGTQNSINTASSRLDLLDIVEWMAALHKFLAQWSIKYWKIFRCKALFPEVPLLHVLYFHPFQHISSTDVYNWGCKCNRALVNTKSIRYLTLLRLISCSYHKN